MKLKLSILFVFLLTVILWSCEAKSKNVSQFIKFHELLFNKTNDDEIITKSHAKFVNNILEIYYEISVPNDTIVKKYINALPDATYRAIKANSSGLKLLKSGVKFKGILIDNIDQTIYREYSIDLSNFNKIGTENYEKFKGGL